MNDSILLCRDIEIIHRLTLLWQMLSLILETALHEANDQIIYAGLKDDFDSGRPEKNLNSFYLSLFVNLKT